MRIGTALEQFGVSYRIEGYMFACRKFQSFTYYRETPAQVKQRHV